jgi:FemAB-related protein (PEP-CTERM system-associated)
MSVDDTKHIASNSFSIELDCSDRDTWDTYVHGNLSSSNYHRYGWRDVIEKSFNHTCYYLAARNDNKCIAGILPLVFMQSRIFGRFLVSLPFFNYGGVLCDHQEIGGALLAAASKLQKKLGAEYAELRQTDPLSGDLPTKKQKVCMILELASDAETQWKRFNAKLRNQIRKADKSGLSVFVGGKELLVGFYDIFSRNMRDLGTPVYAEKFFANVLATFPNDTRIISVYKGEKPIAAGLISYFKNTVEIPWASSIREFNSLCPNNLLYWTALQFAIQNGFQQFDFGRSTPNEGTYRFKEQWGARPTQLHWQYLLCENETLPELNTKNPKYQQAISIWRRMPVFLTKLIGPSIVKNIP